jgi:hypothetical protein
VTPSGTTATCPQPEQWIALYWRGIATPVASALEACPKVDRLWVRRGASWLGATGSGGAASDQFMLETGELGFLHAPVVGVSATHPAVIAAAGTPTPALAAAPAATPTPPPAATTTSGQTTAGVATQSSTTDGSVASRAIDGNTNGNWYENSVTHTTFQPEAWWQVDLGSVQHIGSVQVWNRTDCCDDRLSNFYVFVSDTPFTATDVAGTLAQANVFNHLTTGTAGTPTTVAVNRTGRYVRVQLRGTESLSLAEVRILP